MAIDYLDYASKLNLIDVWKPGNPSGVLTDKRLYTGPNAPGWPADKRGRGLIKHATVGTNSLRYLAGGSIADGRWVCAHYLIPKDTYTVYKLVPDGYGANHCYPGTWRGYVNNINSNFYGVEVENKQDNKDPFTVGQYVKFALVWCYLSQRDGIPDVMMADHRIVANPGHRTDPTTGGLWNEGEFWKHIWGIRSDPRVWAMWGLPQPQV